MSSELRRALARYAAAREKAMRLAVQNVHKASGLDFRMSEWSRSAEEAYSQQWCGIERHADGSFDWPAIARRFRDPGDFKLVLWAPEKRLSGLALATVSGASVRLRFLEGDPRPDCPLKGKRIPAVLDALALYAQGIGRTELRLEQVAEGLKNLYIQVYGFSEVTSRKESPYLKRDV